MSLGFTTYGTKVLLSKGCYLGPATNGLITSSMRFHLYVQKPELRFNKAFDGGGPYPGGGGGPYPGVAWNKVNDINKFYTPVDEKIAKEAKETPFYQVPIENEKEYLSKKINIIMKARIGNKKVEKIYSINEKWEPTAIRITNVVNTTYQKIIAIAENIHRVAKKTKIIIENFKPKK